jgi:hypothetical protein
MRWTSIEVPHEGASFRTDVVRLLDARAPLAGMIDLLPQTGGVVLELGVEIADLPTDVSETLV